MPRKRMEDFVSHLNSDERAQVLGELLKRHPELSEEANAFAQDLINDVSVEAVAEEVADLVTAVGLEEVEGRAGRHDWGYVEPDQAAMDLLEESIEEMQGDMKRRFAAGRERAAEKICLGIVFGLYRVGNTESDVALEWAPEFPEEAAAYTLSTFLEMVPSGRRKAAGKRMLSAVEKDAGEWLDMLQRVVDRAVSAGRPRRE